MSQTLIQTIRRIGFALLALASILVFLIGGRSVESTTEAHSSRIASIQARDRLNNNNAQGAPQQAVVSGWTQIDYLELISEQLNDLNYRLAVDNRVPALLTLLSLGAALNWITKDLEKAAERNSFVVAPVVTTPVITDAIYPSTEIVNDVNV